MLSVNIASTYIQSITIAYSNFQSTNNKYPTDFLDLPLFRTAIAQNARKYYFLQRQLKAATNYFTKN